MGSRCRICLSMDNLHEIFPEREKFPTTNEILQCTGIRISEMSEMPKSLCIGCVYEIQNAYRLRVKASESDMKLREIYNNTMEPQLHETDIFTREIKLEHETLAMNDSVVIKSEPWRAVTTDLYNIDQFKNEQPPMQSTSWAIDDSLAVALDPMPKKSKAGKKEKIKKEAKPKKVKSPKVERLEADTKPQRRERKRKLDSISTYVCVLCGKICNRKSIFEEHMFRHYNSRPYECHHCSKTFNVKKPYECAYCGKTFNWKKAINRHMLTHTGDKTYQCDMCTNSYRALHHLKYHKISSHGTEADKKFQCAACGKRFCANYILNAHIKHYCKSLNNSTAGIVVPSNAISPLTYEIG